MSRTPLMSFLVMALAVTATLAQEQKGEGDASAAPPPAATAPQPPPAASPTPPPPAAAPQAPAPSAPSEENRKITGVLVSTPPNAIVIRDYAGREVTFHVESADLLPKEMRAGDITTIVYREEPGKPSEALTITVIPTGAPTGAPKTPSAPAAPAPSGGATPSLSKSAKAAGEAATSGTTPEAAKPGAATAEAPPAASGAPAAPPPSSTGAGTGPVTPPEPQKPILPEAGGASTDATSTQPESSSGNPLASKEASSSNMLPIIAIAGIVVLGLAVGVWSYIRSHRKDDTISIAKMG